MIIFRHATETEGHLFQEFPRLRNAKWRINSPYDDSYQCIALAASRTDRIWWPWESPAYYWPEGFLRFPVTSPVPASCFVEVFSKKFGYRECDSGDYEFGYQKIVIYANALGVTHMARQHLWGIGWLSKLGALEDIIHESVADVNGDMDPMAQQYGEPVQYMKRSWWIALIRFCLLKSSFAAFKFALYRLVIPWHHKRLDEL